MVCGSLLHQWNMETGGRPRRPPARVLWVGFPLCADGITRMLAGKDAILTTVQHGVDDAASFDLALNRASLPGLIRVQRIRANMAMP